MARQTFHQELREIEEAVIQMASLVESEIVRAVQALTQRNGALAQEVIASDSEVNGLQLSIRSRCIALMALQAPVARDLRELVTVQLVINELERMGDHGVGIAKQALTLLQYEPLPMTTQLTEIGALVRQQVRQGIEAFVDINVQEARTVSEKDDEIDHRYKSFVSQLASLLSSNSMIAQQATSLLFAAHDLERIGDRVTNICEDIIYMVTGELEELN